ncbi:hypothetical protein [Lewinella sp. IMCC34191]|uniref:hypothetical protein n=1 Tax=Lewinella sp. IMCC34191 TaxID=2259172 RepID=UPI000E276908|nr:hypothetical protein [Lewinella sp. IMCC34191]
MIWIALAALLFMLTSLRIVRRAVQEANRQRVLTWPRAVASLEAGEDKLAGSDANHLGETIFYEAALERPYVFYARGKRYTGSRLAPRLDKMNADEAKIFLKGLSQHRKYEVYFNPNRPEESYLTIGKPILGYGKVYLFLIYGLLFPACLAWFGSDSFPEDQKFTILFTVAAVTLVVMLVVYFLAQPVFDLGKLLLPVKLEGKKQAEEEILNDDNLLRSLEERPLPLTDPEKLPLKRPQIDDPI